jgi:hypothetical protein
MQFTYTAPNQKVKKAGFHAIATSRAGASPEAEWLTGLGSGWSGEIYYEQQYTGDVGNFPDQQWSNSSLVTITVTIVNGMANWHGHLEKKSSGTNWQPVFKGPHRLDTSDESEDFGDGTLPAAVQVSMNEASCTYSIQAGAFIGPDGKSPWFVNGKAAKIGEGRWTQCNRTVGCKSGSHDLGMPSLPPLSPMSGKCTDPNHISASYSNRKEQLGDSKNGVMVETMSVNLSRSGTK